MKFAKELDQNLVPEWRAKYLNYKEGKKRVKAVDRAVKSASTTPKSGPRTPGFLGMVSPITTRNSPFFRGYANSPLRNRQDGEAVEQSEPLSSSPAAFGADSRPSSNESNISKTTAATPMLISGKRRADNEEPEMLQYGSIIATPPSTARPLPLELPDPAMNAGDSTTSPLGSSPDRITQRDVNLNKSKSKRSSIGGNNAYEVGVTTPPPRKLNLGSLRPLKSQGRSTSMTTPSESNTPHTPFLRRLFSHDAQLSRQTSRRGDVGMKGLHAVRSSEKSFFDWMDKELDKIETFYKEKEDEAGVRLGVLRDQLHEMRNRRIEEISEAMKATAKEEGHGRPGFLRTVEGETILEESREQINAWITPIERALENAKRKTIGPRPGANSKALQAMGRHEDASKASNPPDPSRDYERRHHEHDVPYRVAKRKLKLALKEYYRGLELLKSYALLNRTGFRKINKKYDKAVNAHPPLRYMSEKVSKAHFVQSEILDGHIHAVEDLYARYFERGNHKLAMGKLRSPNKNQGEFTFTAFRSGIVLGVGAVFAIEGIISGLEIEADTSNATLSIQTSYLLQIYAGYFLMLYLFSLFCLDCAIWQKNKINYPFIFEFDPRHNLAWQQLAEFPCFLFLVFGLFLWVNFSERGAAAMYIYYPVILIFVTVVLIFLPLPTLFHRSRRWFVYSHWRLFCAGLYPVEFRDFFLGDMYCSLTYAMANIELFFCLYAHHWNDPPQCNSTHSRLLGFFSTLPGIWRFLQSLRRYNDSGDAWPHLYNAGKYMATIVYYMTLSLYRIDQSEHYLAAFIVFAAINSVYVSFWDLIMDWSLGQPQARKKYLRDVRGFKPTWPYYIAMILDPILRMNWIAYVVYTHDLQHSSTASFFVAFSEVSRRGMWTLFRVENEHCANVTRFKASRDVPLPYALHPEVAEHEAEAEAGVHEGESTSVAPNTPGTQPLTPSVSQRRGRAYTSSNAEEGDAGTVRHRTPARNLTSIFATAHTKDFEKKRRPGASDDVNTVERILSGSDGSLHEAESSDEEGLEDDEDIAAALDAGNLRHRE